jgi:hypothetical protein
MARTAAEIQTAIDLLRDRMSKGILRVRHGETETTYVDPASMLRAIQALEAELASVQTSRIRTLRFMTSKGFNT